MSVLTVNGGGWRPATVASSAGSVAGLSARCLSSGWWWSTCILRRFTIAELAFATGDYGHLQLHRWFEILVLELARRGGYGSLPIRCLLSLAIRMYQVGIVSACIFQNKLALVFYCPLNTSSHFGRGELAHLGRLLSCCVMRCRQTCPSKREPLQQNNRPRQCIRTNKQAC